MKIDLEAHLETWKREASYDLNNPNPLFDAVTMVRDARILDLIERVRELEAALEFYTKPVQYRIMHDPETEQSVVVIDAEHFNVAQEALRKTENLAMKEDK